MMPNSPRDHDPRLTRAIQSLQGLSLGDAFGECFFSVATNQATHEMYLAHRELPHWQWHWTDDTAMAISIIETLKHHRTIDQDDLAERFARRYTLEDRRGYGGTAHGILRAIHAGNDWSVVSPAVMSGMGSMGNGGAMRAAPLGAYFAGDVLELVEQARRSAEVTHAHLEGQAGAIAVALAAAFMTATDRSSTPNRWNPFFEFILEHTPDSETRARIAQARELPPSYSVDTAVSALGNGSRLTAPDTVPFCLWCAARSSADFSDSMWTTVSGGGDMDTNCAIVGGILAADSTILLPDEWLAHREALPQI
jgi:ADP-ribosylglycohydrolase